MRGPVQLLVPLFSVFSDRVLDKEVVAALAGAPPLPFTDNTVILHTLHRCCNADSYDSGQCERLASSCTFCTHSVVV